MKMIEIINGVTVVIRTPRKVQRGYDLWRIDVTFYSTKPKVAKVRNDYEIWATVDFIEDFLHLPKYPSEKQIKEFAVEFVRKRFSEPDGVIPEEYGAFCSNTTGIKLVEHSEILLSHFNDLKTAAKK